MAVMSFDTTQEILIQGITSTGRTFRPSNWADRLAGVISQFRPQDPMPGDHLTYSPWCFPMIYNNVNSVVVSRTLQERFPHAWDYIYSFARDNDLQILDGSQPGK